MSTIEELRKLEFAPYMRMSDMVVGKEYQIKSASRRSTTFRERIQLQLEEHQLLLPARYNSISEEALADINKQGNFYIINTEAQGKTYIFKFVQQANLPSVNYYTQHPQNMYNLKY